MFSSLLQAWDTLGRIISAARISDATSGVVFPAYCFAHAGYLLICFSLQAQFRAEGAANQPDGQISQNLSSLSRKNIPLRDRPKSTLQLRPSRPKKRGVGHRHERWDGLRWT